MKKTLFRLTQLILLGIILYCGYKIGSYYLERMNSDKQFESIAQEVDNIRGQADLVLTDEDGKGPVSEEDAVKTKVDYKGIMARLLEINEDTKGFLDIQGTKTHYPVVQAEDNSYYLWLDFDKKTNIQGTLFMDYENKPDLKDMNTVIYGHTMMEGDAMFGVLKHYYDQEYVDEMPKTFTFTCQDGIYHYRIFSVYRVPMDAPYRLPNVSTTDWVKFLEETRTKSAADFGFKRPFCKEDRIMTLSTCTDDHNDDFRTALVGVLIQIQK